jgi:hypothetical protein
LEYWIKLQSNTRQKDNKEVYKRTSEYKTEGQKILKTKTAEYWDRKTAESWSRILYRGATEYWRSIQQKVRWENRRFQRKHLNTNTRGQQTMGPILVTRITRY